MTSPAGKPRDWLADLTNRSRERRPVIHPALRSRREALATIRWVGAALPARVGVSPGAASRSTRPSSRSAPRAALARLTGGMVRWTFDLEGHPVRMAAVLKADPEAYLKLSPPARRPGPAAGVDQRRWSRVISAGGAALVAAGPALAQWAAVAPGGGACCGWLGAPADRPLIDRAVVPNRVEKLTSDIVIRALGAVGLAAINQAIAKNPRARDRVQGPDHPRRPRLAR